MSRLNVAADIAEADAEVTPPQRNWAGDIKAERASPKVTWEAVQAAKEVAKAIGEEKLGQSLESRFDGVMERAAKKEGGTTVANVLEVLQRDVSALRRGFLGSRSGHVLDGMHAAKEALLSTMGIEQGVAGPA